MFTAGICTIVTCTLAALVQQLGAQRLVEALDGVLGAAVRPLQRDAAVGQGRADLDDRAAVARQHPAQGRPGAVDEAEVGHLGDPLELLGLDVDEPGEHRGEGDVDPDVDRRRARPRPGRRPCRRLRRRRCRRRTSRAVPPSDSTSSSGAVQAVARRGPAGRRCRRARRTAGRWRGRCRRLRRSRRRRVGCQKPCSWALPGGVGGEGVCGLDQERVDEGLGRLPRSWRWTTSNSSVNRPGGPRAPRLRSNQRTAPVAVSLLVRGERQVEAAEQERALGLVQRSRSLSEPVHVAVGGELVDDRSPGRPAARVVGGDGAAERGQQQGGVDAGVVGCALPTPVGVQAVLRGVGHDRGRPAPTTRPPGRGVGRRRRAARRRRSAGSGSSAAARAPRSPRPARRAAATIASTAASAAFHPSASRTSSRSAAAKSSSASPKASSWNWCAHPVAGVHLGRSG